MGIVVWTSQNVRARLTFWDSNLYYESNIYGVSVVVIDSWPRMMNQWQLGVSGALNPFGVHSFLKFEHCLFALLLLELPMRIRLLFSLLRKLLVGCRRSWLRGFRSIGRLIAPLLSNPQIGELWRFIFLGSLVETGRIVGQKAVEALSSCMLISIIALWLTDKSIYLKPPYK
jgi:hypothetical protein